MATATKVTEFLINGEWVFHNSYTSDKFRTYSELRRAQGDIDLPHKKVTFEGGVKVEITHISHLGEGCTVRDTITWA